MRNGHSAVVENGAFGGVAVPQLPGMPLVSATLPSKQSPALKKSRTQEFEIAAGSTAEHASENSELSTPRMPPDEMHPGAGEARCSANEVTLAAIEGLLDRKLSPMNANLHL